MGDCTPRGLVPLAQEGGGWQCFTLIMCPGPALGRTHLPGDLLGRSTGQAQ